MKTEENQDSWDNKIADIVAPARRGMSDSFD